MILGGDGLVLDRLSARLAREGYRIEATDSIEAALDAIETRDFDTLVADSALARGQRDLLAEIRARDAALPVVVTAADGDEAGDAIRRGARAVVEPSGDDARLVSSVRTCVDLARAVRRARRLEAEAEMLRPVSRPMLVADAPAMKPVVELITRIAASGANVLVTGENGTGKATVARTVHALSPRARGPFITTSASATPENAIEAALFGQSDGQPGADAADAIGGFELADGGTLYLEEVAALPLTVQSAVLRAVETGAFERIGSSKTRRAAVRVISSTAVSLRDEVAAGRFRQDLLFRLGTVEIALPPLRQRREDIPALAHQFLRHHARRHRRTVTGFEHAAMQVMLTHEWPGNIRELELAVERGVLRAPGTAARAVDLGLQPAGAETLEEMSLEHVEVFLIGKALSRAEGNVSRAAKALGLSRSALYRRLQRHGL